MAVTGQWLQATLIDTPAGPRYTLMRRTNLIGFLRVPGHHDGEHLATMFIYILDRIDIAFKVGPPARYGISFTHYIYSSLVGLLLTTHVHPKRHLHDVLWNESSTSATYLF
jgi:hypothetical protein